MKIFSDPTLRRVFGSRSADSKKARYRVRDWGRLSLESLESRCMLTGSPVLDPLDDVVVQSGSPLHIPLTAIDPEGQALTYTASSSVGGVTTLIPVGNRSLRITVAGFGEMVFELFEQRVPRVTSQIIELAQSGFYDGVIFHRVIDGFVIQGGDPTGTGSGGSFLGDFDDQFQVDLQHNRSGILSMAKSTDDTNDSQFFITEGPTRSLDFNHSIFGILVDGEEVREAISNVATGAGDRPITPVVMESVEVFFDFQNAVLMVSAPEGALGTTEITVTATDEDLNETSQSFTVSFIPDGTNSHPFLDDIAPVETAVNTPVTFQLSANDVEGDVTFFLDEAALDSLTLFVPIRSHPDLDYSVDLNTGEVSVTPTNGLEGTHFITVATARFTDAVDYQVVPILIAPSDPVDVEVDLRLVHERTPTDDVGEADDVPDGVDWIDEWGGFWVEVWVSTPTSGNIGVASATVDLTYDTERISPVQIEYGAGFRSDQSGVIDDTAGTISGLGATSVRLDLGDDAAVLLARVRFLPDGDDIPLAADGQYVEAHSVLSFALSQTAAELVVGDPSITTGADLSVELWPVMFDVDDNGKIEFGDLAVFSAAYLKNVGDTPETWKSDFDHSGRVDLGDLSLLAASFLRSGSTHPLLTYSLNFPADWREEPIAPDTQALASLFEFMLSTTIAEPAMADNDSATSEPLSWLVSSDQSPYASTIPSSEVEPNVFEDTGVLSFPSPRVDTLPEKELERKDDELIDSLTQFVSHTPVDPEATDQFFRMLGNALLRP